MEYLEKNNYALISFPFYAFSRNKFANNIMDLVKNFPTFSKETGMRSRSLSDLTFSQLFTIRQA